MRRLSRFLVPGLATALLIFFWWTGNDGGRSARAPSRTQSSQGVVVGADQSWGNPASLPDHFARHGADFGARDAEEYARMAAEFLQRAKDEGLPAKVDRRGIVRVFDPRSGAFAAYNRDGTTKTFFKPGSRGYFERQPGKPVDWKTWKPR